MDDKRLLIVDDDADTCANLSDILTDHGFDVQFAYGAPEALVLFGERRYQLALLDFKLPCMTGVELFRRMRLMDGNIIGLLVTAFASIETERQAESAGLRHVVSKPLELPSFLRLIEQALV